MREISCRQRILPKHTLIPLIPCIFDTDTDDFIFADYHCCSSYQRTTYTEHVSKFSSQSSKTKISSSIRWMVSLLCSISQATLASVRAVRVHLVLGWLCRFEYWCMPRTMKTLASLIFFCSFVGFISDDWANGWLLPLILDHLSCDGLYGVS